MPANPNPPDKASVRRRLRVLRRAVPAATRKRAGQAVLRLALSHRLLSRKRRVGLYIPAKGELDCLPLLDRALWLGAACCLPVVPRARQRMLWFSRLGDGPHWGVNRYGIPEYGHRGFERLRAADLDILFMPLLGFDTAGYRMGMGGGYYDASLAYLTRRRHWHRPRLIGLAFEAQRVDVLPRDPWDIPLDAVITEQRYYRFNSGNVRG
ncbi:5-formyltetrahydrofolate cyclo-ligase [Parasulfuritortus cantonensis]|uniref:5-formyltetrahydrofolate cyclo-ligase n=1 Tax=Parasulfuritortus cantonensis TaxID=2528202 RepID=A0A4R1B4K2_9PROT|nr:5-formyltetrahydrofolate cyclo-ligase [Parasulfuritortus cantonensis]TCJ12861.1 5-formyltetrahydrofolate cyclo-ligase [Parasulfuritortus cantonensis]